MELPGVRPFLQMRQMHRVLLACQHVCISWYCILDGVENKLIPPLRFLLQFFLLRPMGMVPHPIPHVHQKGPLGYLAKFRLDRPTVAAEVAVNRQTDTALYIY